jgi:hypothetical protein
VPRPELVTALAGKAIDRKCLRANSEC